MARQQRVVVVGGGLAGLAAVMKLAEFGISVDLISMVPVKRSHSVCAQGGINAVNHVTRSLGDADNKHFDDTVYGGAFLQHQPPVKEMCDWGERIVDLMDRIGVMFNRTPEGHRDLRRFGGTLYKRTAFAGATTGQQLLYALDEQVRRWESEGIVTKYELWEFLAPIIDDRGICRGAAAQDMRTMQIRAFPADAVVLATGGNGMIFGKSTNSVNCTGAAGVRAFRAGVKYGNPEFVQVHPTAIPGSDKNRLMSESIRGEGGRIWVPRTPGDRRDPNSIPPQERWFFLEEKYPKYGNLVPRDIATREIFDVCVNKGLSVEKDEFCVYLDITEMSPASHKKLAGVLEIYERFQGVDPRTTPMRIFPSVHYTMGGLWVDYEKDGTTGGLVVGSPRNQMTNIPGLFAIGEADYHYHGANRLGANSLLSCIFSGLLVAPGIDNWLHGLPAGAAADQPASLFDAAVADHGRRDEQLISRRGTENPYTLHRELGQVMTRNVTVVRYDARLRETLNKIDELRDRCQRIELADKGRWSNQNLSFARALGDMLLMARVIAEAALLRDESRGAHFKPECDIPPVKADASSGLRDEVRRWCEAFEKQNERWLRSTIATCVSGECRITYEPVDTSLIPPRPRTYGMVGAEVIEQVWWEMHPGAGPRRRPGEVSE
ncbi:MAG TPA: succinate dehydrogenase flavoprotein subunit [Phycisphaerae bacterium]|nr:succinate dehydrogenase flavoprotein subunit [Phycisphaerae bacterium]